MTTVTERDRKRLNSTPVAKEYTYKAVLAGKYGVGKTSLFLRLQGQQAVRTEDRPACMDKYDFVHTINENQTVKLTVWDTAGMERNHSLTEGYYRNTHAVILVGDISDRESLHDCSDVVEMIKSKHLSPYTKFFFIANKWDLHATSDLTESAIHSFSKNLKVQETYFTSALSSKTDEIKEIFIQIINTLVSMKKQPSMKKRNEFAERRKEPKKSSSLGCC